MYQRDSWASYSLRKILIYAVFFMLSVIVFGISAQGYEAFRFRCLSKQIQGYLSDQKIHKFALEIQSESSMNFPFEIYIILDGKNKEVAYEVGNDIVGVNHYSIELAELVKETKEINELEKEEDIIEFLKKQIHQDQIQIVNPIWEKKIQIALQYQIHETWISILLHEIDNE